MASSDAVILGRFQPLHRGHETLLDYAARQYDRSFVLVADYGERRESDPLLYDERRRIVEALYPDATVLPGDDTGDMDSTIESIERSVPETFTALTGSEWTRELFETNDYPVELFAKDEYEFHATDIRERIRREEPWRRFVSADAYEHLRELNFERRVRETAAAN